MSQVFLTAVHIRKDGKLEASDGYSIAVTDTGSAYTNQVMLPAVIAAEVVKLKPVKMCVVGSWIHFETTDNVVLSGRLIEGDYVDTASHLKVEGEEFIFPKNILDILERATVFSKRDFFLDELISITLSNKKMTVKSKSETGWFEESERLRYKGDSVIFSIPPYILNRILTRTKNAIISASKINFVGEDWQYMALLREPTEN